jgi:deoxyribonuclease IV
MQRRKAAGKPARTEPGTGKATTSERLGTAAGIAPAATDELGAHVSSAGGVRNAPARAAVLDSVVLQLFTKQPSRWAEPLLDPGDAAAYRAEVQGHGIRAAASHDSYLINLASPDAVLRQRSLESFRAELRRCVALGIPFLVSHPGNATDGDVASALARNAEAVQQALEEVDGVHALLETTAGTGRALGATFPELAALIDAVGPALQHRVGVCFDTCHVWAAGYDLRDAYHDVMARFDDAMGVERIRLFHLNDSVGLLGSRRDRHAHIGQGALGDPAFRQLLLDDRFRTIPKLLETPKDDDAVAADRANLTRLRAYRT